MKPTNRDQFDAAMANRIPTPDAISDGTWSIPVAMPSPQNPYTLCYVIAGTDGSLTLIDPGYDTEQNWLALEKGLRSFGLPTASIVGVFVTHLHPDHLGMATRVRDQTGARVTMLRQEQEAAIRLGQPGDVEATFDGWGLPNSRRDELRTMGRMSQSEVVTTADVLLVDGDRLDVAGRSLEVVWTPGHTPGHACVVDRVSGVVYTGDHVLPRIFPGLGLGGATPTNPIADYFRSLDRIDAFADLQVAPGHGYRFAGLDERTAETREHHLRRSREAARAIKDRPRATVYEIATQLTWTAGWKNLTGFYLFSALNQTEQHLGFVRSDAFPG